MIKAAKVLATVVHLLARLLAVGALLGMLYVMLMVTYEVVLRQTNQPGITGYVEYVEVALTLTVFLALGETERRRAHVSVEMVIGRLKGPAYVAVRALSGGAAAVVAILLAWASWDVLADSLARGEYKLGLVSIPMWPARAAVFAGFAVLAMEQVITAVEDIVHRDDPVEEEPGLASYGV